MSHPNGQPAHRAGRAPAVIGAVIGLSVNVVVYLVAWWASRRVSSDYGGVSGFGGIVAFEQVVLYGTCLMLLSVGFASAVLVTRHRSFTRALVIGTTVSIVVVPASIPVIALLRQYMKW